MGELKHCQTCNKLFNFIGLKDVCNDCALNEEKMFDVVYRFLRKRENRAANIERIMEVTGVEESLLYKWVRNGRLQTAVFPNLGYPCDQCGKLTKQGKLCENCTDELTAGLRQFEAAKAFREKIAAQDAGTYYNKK